MKKKESKELKELLAMLEVLKEASEEHHFDADSDKCRNCETFECCRIFHGMLDKIEAADIEEDVKNDLTQVLVFIKEEFIIIDKDVEFHKFRFQDITERFETLKKCKNFDVLVDILDKNELKYLRGIVLKVTGIIEDELNKVIEANRAECNHFMNILRKPEIEEKSYEDMTKEELIELLKNQ